MTKTIRNEGIYSSLIDQLDKLARHNRQGSYQTKSRYYKAMKRFCAFLADEYHLQKLANISPKHLNAYVAKLQAEGKAVSTIKTDLAAIRFFHDKLSEAKYRLPDNDHLSSKLERRKFGGVATISYYAGLRIHECFRLDTAAAEGAIRTGHLMVKGKGGKIRTVPINESIRIELRRMLERTERGHKLFVPDGTPTHIAINQMQGFIHAVRDEIADPDRERPMTHHGLRHTYAARTYQEKVDGGTAVLDAHYQVSRLLGHERPDVTDIYLASVKKEGDGDET